MDNYHKMRVSLDADRSDPKDLCSLGVVDLDLSLSPDVFGLRAFDTSKPLTRMLPGSPCELWLMLPVSDIGPEGFHDIIIDNLAATPTWRSRHISPGDVTSLRQQWPKAVFRTMRRRSWISSVVWLVVDRSGGIGIVGQSVRNRSPLPWAST